MSQNSENLKLPYIMPAQAQKHVTHNEAIRALDALVQISLKSMFDNNPPLNPAQGERHLVGDDPTASWSGNADKIAAFQDGAWAFFQPVAGWVAWNETSNLLMVFDGGQWNALQADNATTEPDDTVPFLGVNTTADLQNRIAVASNNTLLTHDGSSHRLKVNKASETETASLLLQDDFTGAAEMGLIGSNNFTVKTSADGQSWHDGMVIHADKGIATFPNKPFGLFSRVDGWQHTQPNQAWGFTHSEYVSGIELNGTELAPGLGSGLVVPINGIYFISINIYSRTNQSALLKVVDSLTNTIVMRMTVNNSSAPVFASNVSAIVPLNAGAVLSMSVSGALQLHHGPRTTYMNMCLIG